MLKKLCTVFLWSYSWKQRNTIVHVEEVERMRLSFETDIWFHSSFLDNGTNPLKHFCWNIVKLLKKEHEMAAVWTCAQKKVSEYSCLWAMLFCSCNETLELNCTESRVILINRDDISSRIPLSSSNKCSPIRSNSESKVQGGQGTLCFVQENEGYHAIFHSSISAELLDPLLQSLLIPSK